MYLEMRKYVKIVPIFLLFISGVFAIFSLTLKYSLAERPLLSPLSSKNVGVVIAQAVSETTPQTIETKVVAEDGRLELIKRYLEHYHSPLLPYSDLIYSLANTYEFDYRWILAIGQQESNLCKKIIADSHNCWGYGIHSKGTLTFNSYELALKSYAAYLKRGYFDKGLNTPELIERKYNPVSNGSWAYGVGFFMDQIEKGDF